ncbi:MAG: hypothetical protein ABW001_08155 [Mycobacterium sp.]
MNTPRFDQTVARPSGIGPASQRTAFDDVDRMNGRCFVPYVQDPPLGPAGDPSLHR